MFSTHNINHNQLSVRNIILLFLTIIFGFASVITLAQITIPSSIENARQTIKRITITTDGTDVWSVLRDINYDNNGSTKIVLNTTLEQTNFSWRVLALDNNDNLVYSYSEQLAVSWAGGGAYREANANDIYASNTGNVGIGTSTMSGKLHIQNSGEVELYLQETNPANAANINFQTTQQRWMIGWFNTYFYIWLSWDVFLNITTWGFVGIWIGNPQARLQVNGNIIAWREGNIITGSNSAIIWGGGNGQINQISGNNSFIAGGKDHDLNGEGSAIIGWSTKNSISNSNGAFLLGWWGNEIQQQANNSAVIWGNANKITLSTEAIIAGWWSNIITSWESSIIVAGKESKIINAKHSFVWWYNARNSWHNYTFVRNSSSDSTTPFSAGKAASFLINVPGGMGINTPNPQAALHVSGDIRGNNLTITNAISANSLQLSPSSINTWNSCAATPWMIIYKWWSFYWCDNGWIRKKLDN